MGQMAGNLGNSNVMDPQQAEWGDLSGGEKGSRLAGGAAKGLLQGWGNYTKQNAALRQGNGGAPIMPAQPDQAPMFSAQNLPGGRPTRDPFYGG